jgi:hypothetical protein
LDEPEFLEFHDEADALSQLVPGQDGVIFFNGCQKATFLPQVWEQLPDRRSFMAALKQKARLPRRFLGPQCHARALQGTQVEGKPPRRLTAWTPIPLATGTFSKTAASSATFARGIAGCMKASAGACFVRKRVEGKMVLTTLWAQFGILH